MKFLTLENGQLGAVVGETAVDLVAAAAELNVELAADTLLGLVEADDAATVAAWALAEKAAEQNVASRAYADVTPLAPIPVPTRNILCLGKNYQEHANEVAKKMKTSADKPPVPIIFTKAVTSVIGPEASFPAYEELTSKLDYEAEVGLIIGKTGTNIAPEDAWDYVYGYTAINDVSARDLQKSHFQWFRAKSLDGFCPMGPLVVHRSIMPEPKDIRVKCFVNGEERQNETFDKLIFDVPAMISKMSAGMTLTAGDIIATGTPAGVGMGFTPSKYLKAGDEVVVDVTGVGPLRNFVK
ncbi:MAG: fumarylacetoacetate hydrolase family protein [Pseudomonadales bacterium]